MRKTLSFALLSGGDQSLVRAALDAAKNAYAPYSGFAVGAAVRTKNGEIFTGSNLENTVFGLGMCAEVGAITAANSAGQFSNLEAIAVAGYKFTEPLESKQIVTPCGRCRQLIFEAAQISNVDIRVLSCSGDLDRIIECTIADMLPDAFGPTNLGLDKSWLHMRRELLLASEAKGAQTNKSAVIPIPRKR